MAGDELILFSNHTTSNQWSDALGGSIVNIGDIPVQFNSFTVGRFSNVVFQALNER